MSIFCNSLLLIIASVIATSSSQIQFYDKYCVKGSVISSDIDGTYEFAYLDSNTNESIWYNAEKDKYLFPWIPLSQHAIGSDPTVYAAHAYCQKHNATSCLKGWKYWDGNTFSDDTNMRIVNCNDRCITSNNNEQSLFGTYIWSHFNYTTNSSIFYCSSNNMFLSDHLNGHSTVYNKSYTTTDLNVTQCTESCYGGIQTHYYGTHTPNSQFNAINQGKINEIVSWSVYNDSSASIYKAIGNLDFIPTQQSNPMLSTDSYFIPCNPFTLDNNDYINGYRVIYKEQVYALFFYTANNKQYNCSAKDLNYSKYYDTGIIKDNNYYLSGFKIRYKIAIDSISFQFTAVNNCTESPTQFPTVNPTNFPTLNPSIHPTLNPTTNPTIVPTELPTLHPTVNPTIATNEPTIDPTLEALIVENPTIAPTFITTDVIKQNVSVLFSTTDEPNIVSVKDITFSKSIILIIIVSGGVMITLLTISIICKKCVGARVNESKSDIPKTVLPPIQTHSKSTKPTSNVPTTEMIVKTDTIARQKQSIEMLTQIWDSYPLPNEYGDVKIEKEGHIGKTIDGDDSSHSDLYDSSIEEHETGTGTAGGEVIAKCTCEA